MKVAYFPGCTIPYRLNHYELALRKVAETLGIELVDIKDFGCCGYPILSSNRMATILLAAYNLALAESQGYNVTTGCPACASMLTHINETLKVEEELRKRVSKRLGMKYEGTVEVKHFTKFLYEDYGVRKIKEKITKPLTGLKVTPHYMCHTIRPSLVMGFGTPEYGAMKPFDELIEVTGASLVEYPSSTKCCGAPDLATDVDVAYQTLRDRLDDVQKAEARVVISSCPYCHIHFDIGQSEVEDKFKTKYTVISLLYPQLLGLSLGLTTDELGLMENSSVLKHQKAPPEDLKPLYKLAELV